MKRLFTYDDFNVKETRMEVYINYKVWLFGGGGQKKKIMIISFDFSVKRSILFDFFLNDFSKIFSTEYGYISLN